MKLIGSTTSPYVRKVRVYLEETNLPHTFVPVDAWQLSQALLALAPLGKVPVLERDDGSVLFDSALIIESLESLLPPQRRLLQAEGEGRWATLRWHALAHGIIDATVARVLELRRPEALRIMERLVHEEVRIALAIAFSEAALDGFTYLVADSLSLADLMLGATMQYIDVRCPHDWRSGASRLAAWCHIMHDRPSFVSTQPPGFVRPA
jgi:glutathione S-transferase